MMGEGLCHSDLGLQENDSIRPFQLQANFSQEAPFNKVGS